MREVPSIISELAQGIARELGKRVYDPNSLDRMARQAREAARGMGSRPVPRRGMGRDDGMSL